MPPPAPLGDERSQKASLLAEAIDLLLREIGDVIEDRWEDIPDLKRQKTILASRFRQIDWTTGPEPSDGSLLRARLAFLEEQSRNKIKNRLELIRNQMMALQELHLYWLECLTISFGKLHTAPMPDT